MPLLNHALDLFFPPQCLHCEALVPTHGTLCLTCWQQVQFIADPICLCCGHPFDYALGDGALCGNCLRDKPPYARARSMFRYDDTSRVLVLKLKYQDQLHLAGIYGTWLAKAGREIIIGSDFIVPVPLYYWRFVGRRYNQAALLAHALGKECGLPVIPDALLRMRATESQSGLTHSQRHTNVKGAFDANSNHAPAIKGKNILLVDDVMTTGATLSECTRCLLNNGVLSVNVLTLARTVI
jgi:ComF family protein